MSVIEFTYSQFIGIWQLCVSVPISVFIFEDLLSLIYLNRKHLLPCKTRVYYYTNS